MQTFLKSVPNFRSQRSCTRLKKIKTTWNGILMSKPWHCYKRKNNLQKRKNIVLEDKKKILKIIVDMDKKKEIEVKNAWRKVNENFGNIFSTLLPGKRTIFPIRAFWTKRTNKIVSNLGAEAKLVPAEGNNSLSGLTVRVGFSGMWKDSLGELSGGQRSLVALSLMLRWIWHIHKISAQC